MNKCILLDFQLFFYCLYALGKFTGSTLFYFLEISKHIHVPHRAKNFLIDYLQINNPFELKVNWITVFNFLIKEMHNEDMENKLCLLGHFIHMQSTMKKGMLH